MQGQSASQAVEEAERANRMALLGGPGHVFQFDPDGPLEAIKEGQVADRVMAWIGGATPEEVAWFKGVNREPLRQFWGRQKADALAINKAIEAKLSQKEITING